MKTMDADSKTIISNILSTRKERNYLPKYLCLVVLSWHLPLLLSGGQKALDWQSWSEGNTLHLKYKKTNILNFKSVNIQGIYSNCVWCNHQTFRITEKVRLLIHLMRFGMMLRTSLSPVYAWMRQTQIISWHLIMIELSVEVRTLLQIS